jgi:integrase
MAATKLTKGVVDAVTSDGSDLYLWDTDPKGFGLRVTSAGVKSFVLQYRAGTGRGAPSKRMTIGRYGSPWTVETARKEARRLLGLVADGQNPAADRKAERAAQAEAVAVASTRTFRAVADTFIDRYAKARNDSWKETKRLLDREVMPVWGDKDIGTITRGDAVRLLDDIAASGRGTTANRVHSAVRKVFNWAAPRYDLDVNPAARLEKVAPEVSRDRVLSDDEVRLIWRAAGDLGHPFRDIIRLMILTLQRRDEVGGIERGEIDVAGRIWTIPANRAKNGREHIVHLSDAALEIIKGLPWIHGSTLAFTTTGKTPVSGFSKAKVRLDVLIDGIRRKEAAERGEDPQSVLPLPPWQFHDIRRTGTTGMARLGIPPHIADKVLNHVTGSIAGVAAIYNRHEYLTERRAALDTWADHVNHIVTGKKANVTRLRRKA